MRRLRYVSQASKEKVVRNLRYVSQASKEHNLRYVSQRKRATQFEVHVSRE